MEPKRLIFLVIIIGAVVFMLFKDRIDFGGGGGWNDGGNDNNGGETVTVFVEPTDASLRRAVQPVRDAIKGKPNLLGLAWFYHRMAVAQSTRPMTTEQARMIHKTAGDELSRVAGSVSYRPELEPVLEKLFADYIGLEPKKLTQADRDRISDLFNAVAWAIFQESENRVTVLPLNDGTQLVCTDAGCYIDGPKDFEGEKLPDYMVNGLVPDPVNDNVMKAQLDSFVAAYPKGMPQDEGEGDDRDRGPPIDTSGQQYQTGLMFDPQELRDWNSTGLMMSEVPLTSGKGATRLLYKALQEFDPPCYTQERQTTGDCFDIYTGRLLCKNGLMIKETHDVLMHDMSTKPINEVVVGDMVMTPTGSVTEVVRVIKQATTKRIIDLTVRGRKLRVTEDHLILVDNGGGQKWVAAGELEDGDKVFVPSVQVPKQRSVNVMNRTAKELTVFDNRSSYPDERYTRNRGSWTLANIPLIHQVHTLCLSACIQSSVCYRKARENRKPSATVYIASEGVSKVLGVKNPKRKDPLIESQKRQGGFAFPVKVERLPDSYRPEYVYCIEVASEEHAFICNNVAVHNCTSHAFRNACDTSRAFEILINDDPEDFRVRGATEAIYGYRGHSGQGMSPFRAAQFVSKHGGVMLRRPYGSIDTTSYDANIGINWGRRGGPPEELVNVLRENQMQKAALVNNVEEARDAIFNGYALAVGSDYGFESKRDKYGFAGKKGSWMHCMAWVAVSTAYELAGDDWQKYGSEKDSPCFLVANSWGVWNGGPTGKFEIPDGSFWITSRDAAGMIGQKMSFAVGSFNGFAASPLNDWGFVYLASESKGHSGEPELNGVVEQAVGVVTQLYQPDPTRPDGSDRGNDGDDDDDAVTPNKCSRCNGTGWHTPDGVRRPCTGDKGNDWNCPFKTSSVNRISLSLAA